MPPCWDQDPRRPLQQQQVLGKEGGQVVGQELGQVRGQDHGQAAQGVSLLERSGLCGLQMCHQSPCVFGVRRMTPWRRVDPLGKWVRHGCAYR